jgi:anti-sigma regulatory factor (Ser/Thr protein kinase)
VRIEGADEVGLARRNASVMASQLGFSEADAARAALVATECATNLWKHAGGGEILLTQADDAGERFIEILALDKGPGMANVTACRRDGYSTAGSNGTGFGAMERMSSECHIHSEPGKGTAVLSRIRGKADAESPSRSLLRIGAVSVPKRGESVCGDGFTVRQDEGVTSILVVDGLGHGPDAAGCARTACRTFENSRRREPVEAMRELDEALRQMRGAAAAVARFEPAQRQIRFTGVGNIAGAIYDGRETRHMASMPGIVGQGLRSVKEFTYPWPPNGTVLLYSDGIATHWSLGAYDALLLRDPSLLAGVVYRDWNRGRDDATVIVIRERALP